MKTLTISGSREWADYEAFSNYVDLEIEKRGGVDAIKAGDCPTGVDVMADRYARKHELHFFRFAAKWSTEGNKAGPIRNSIMLKVEPRPALDFAHYPGLYGWIAFPGPTSKGTVNFIAKAEDRMAGTIIEVDK